MMTRWFRSRVCIVSVTGGLTWLMAGWLHLPWLASFAGWTAIVGIVGFCVHNGCAARMLWLYDNGHYPQALGWSRPVCLLSHVLYGTKSLQHAFSLNNLAVLYQDIGRYEAAEPLYQRALAIRERQLGVDHPNTAASLNNLAELYQAMGRYDDAIHYFREGIRIENGILARIASAFPEAQVYSFAQTLTGSTYAFLTLVWHHGYHDHAAGLDLVLARKAIAYEAAAAQHLTALTDASPALQAAFAQLQQVRITIARQYMQGPAPGETPAQRAQRLHTLQEACAQLEHNLARHVPAIALEQRLRDANRSAIAQALPAGSTLVEWVRFQPYRFESTTGEHPWEPARYMAFLLPAGAPEAVQMIDCGEADPIDLLIARFYGEVAEQALPPDIEERVINAGPVDPCRALYDQVFAPIIAAIGSSTGTDGVPHLIMAPDGALCQLPFGALLSAAQRFVIQDYLISYVTVGRDVVQFDAPAMASGGAAIVADPDYDLSLQTPDDETTPPEAPDDDLLRGRTATPPQWRTSLGPFAPLAGARAEGQAVSRILQDAGVKMSAEWIGRDALDGRLKALRKPVILHLATHGFFLPDPATQLREPWTRHRDTRGGSLGDFGQFLGPYGMAHNPLLCSGLALAGVNTWLEGVKPVPPEAEDGVLTALDVLTLDMHGTELVTLSACQTGQGGILHGEGVVGLRRAFTLVGARTLVLALWNVPDAETRRLMEHFYTAMLAGQGTLGKAAALRQAQLALLQQLRQRHAGEADPRLWAGFICQGDPAPLRGQPSNV